MREEKRHFSGCYRPSGWGMLRVPLRQKRLLVRAALYFLSVLRCSFVIFVAKENRKCFPYFLFRHKITTFQPYTQILDNKIKIFLTFLHFYTFFYSLVLHFCTFPKPPKDFFFPPLIRCSLRSRLYLCSVKFLYRMGSAYRLHRRWYCTAFVGE